MSKLSVFFMAIVVVLVNCGDGEETVTNVIPFPGTSEKSPDDGAAGNGGQDDDQNEPVDDDKESQKDSGVNEDDTKSDNSSTDKPGQCITETDGTVICVSKDELADVSDSDSMSQDQEMAPDDLPARVNLREDYLQDCGFEPKDQQHCGYCVDHSTASALEALQCKNGLQVTKLSPAHIRYISSGDMTCKKGNNISIALGAVMSKKVVPASVWPYVPPWNEDDKIQSGPPDDVLEHEGLYGITAFGVIRIYSLDDLKKALASGYFVLLSVPVTYSANWSPSYPAWDDGHIAFYPIQEDEEMCGKSATNADFVSCTCNSDSDCPDDIDCFNGRCINGWHAVLALGYDDDTETVTFLNSWGVWNEKIDGIGTFSYEFIRENCRGGYYPLELTFRDTEAPVIKEVVLTESADGLVVNVIATDNEKLDIVEVRIDCNPLLGCDNAVYWREKIQLNCDTRSAGEMNCVGVITDVNPGDTIAVEILAEDLAGNKTYEHKCHTVSDDPPVDPYCGDGLRNGAEECDGNDLNDQTCAGLGYINGTLSCNANCSFNDSACEQEPASQVCGNGIIEGTEKCDNNDPCCANCTYASAGTVCRAKANECDVAETCPGTNAICPSNGFKTNGTACSGGTCQNGTCLACEEECCTLPEGSECGPTEVDYECMDGSPYNCGATRWKRYKIGHCESDGNCNPDWQDWIYIGECSSTQMCRDSDSDPRGTWCQEHDSCQ